MTDHLDTALRYVTGEHTRAVRLRDQLAALQREAAQAGDMTAALARQVEVARLEGLLDGLNTATVQLRMVRDRLED